MVSWPKEIDLETPHGALFFLAKLNQLDGRQPQARELYKRVIDIDEVPRELVASSFLGLYQLAPESEREDVKRQLAALLARDLPAEEMEELGFFSDNGSFNRYLAFLKEAVGSDDHPDLRRLLVRYHLERRRRR